MPIRTENNDRFLVLFISGEIDHHNCLSLREELDLAIRTCTKSEVVLDLSETDFCDSSALGLILGRVRVAGEAGLSLSVRNPSRRVHKILTLCGAQKYLKFI
jgi:stage II sporulation protein AA (anti-sigma F factor antagonist)